MGVRTFSVRASKARVSGITEGGGVGARDDQPQGKGENLVGLHGERICCD